MSSGASGIRESKFLRERRSERGGREGGEKGGGGEGISSILCTRRIPDCDVSCVICGSVSLAQHTYHHGNRFSSLNIETHGGSRSSGNRDRDIGTGRGT